MNFISNYSKIAIEILESRIRQMGYVPYIHFELEGCYIPTDPQSVEDPGSLDYPAINHKLVSGGIRGRLKPEYWRHQWEFVTEFAGQSPFSTASDLHRAMNLLPTLLKQHGAATVLIKPVVWGGDQRRLLPGSRTLFSEVRKTVHIPNAIQINISAYDRGGNNMLPVHGLGERLQNRLLQTSRECCLLYLPEAEAFERLQLPRKFGLGNELSSPTELSGGHQGSIALYKQLGKHNQKIGITPTLVDSRNRLLSSIQNWRPFSRIEHRLGASSTRFNPYVNTVFALANLHDALTAPRESTAGPDSFPALPDKLFSDAQGEGAYEIFRDGCWLESTINRIATEMEPAAGRSIPQRLGSLIKQAVLETYRKPVFENTQPAGSRKPEQSITN